MLKNPFKTRGYYVFNYQPRYYDEQKERLKNLEKKYKKNNADFKTPYQITLSKNNLKNHWHRAKNNHHQERKTLFRLALIITFLVGILAYIFEIHKMIK